MRSLPPDADTDADASPAADDQAADDEHVIDDPRTIDFQPGDRTKVSDELVQVLVATDLLAYGEMLAGAIVGDDLGLDELRDTGRMVWLKANTDVLVPRVHRLFFDLPTVEVRVLSGPDRDRRLFVPIHDPEEVRPRLNLDD